MPAAARARDRKVANRLHRMPYPVLFNAAQVTLNNLTSAAGTFPSPPIPLATLTTDIVNFANAVVAWGAKNSRGSKAQFNALQAAKQVLVIDLTSEALYVEGIAQSSAPSNVILQLVTILLGGMRAKADNKVINLFSKPRNVRQLINFKGLAGFQVYCKWKVPAMGRKSAVPSAYDIYISADGASFGHNQTTTKTSATITLPSPGPLITTNWYVKIRATGAAGTGAWSDIAVVFPRSLS